VNSATGSMSCNPVSLIEICPMAVKWKRLMKALEYHSRLVINGDQIGYEEILHLFLLNIPK
jgi:hypothetical protein